MSSSASAAASVVSAANKAQNFANQTVENGRFEAIKEPIGFIKIVQFFMAILAFAIAVNGSSSLALNAKCQGAAADNKFVTFEASYKYPYDLTGVPFVRTTSCPEGSSAPKLDRDTLTKEGYNIKSSAEWFVFVGVTSFLYSLAMLVVYVFMKHKYDNIVYLPLIDFVVTVLFALCWFIADIAWAKAISDIQHHTNTENVISSLESTCPKIGNSSSRDCQIKTYASYGSIIISCIIGFCNLILWAGNIWFVLKETTWYKTRQQLRQQQQNITNNPISASGSNVNMQAQFSNINNDRI